MGKEDPRSITSQPENGTIDIPHEPDAEAALLQEARERISMLETHMANPEAVASRKNLSDELYSLVRAVADAEEYNCNCEDRYESLKQE